MTPEVALVERLASKTDRMAAMRALIGGVNARELRSAQVTDAAFDALLGGLAHPNPQVRWWSIQLLDHCPDARAIDAIGPLLDDPVPRVRRNAVHAVTCRVCKPAWSATLPATVGERLAVLAASDANDEVRAEATAALATVSRGAT